MKPKINVLITATGIESIYPVVDNEQEQVTVEEIREKIQPCLDVIDAILKKSSAGPRG